jgi:hypothetical protein
MTTTPETWIRYPRSTDPAKDVAALVARLNDTKRWLRYVAHTAGDQTRDKVLILCTILDREHDEWIAQRGVEAVRKAVMPDGEWE